MSDGKEGKRPFGQVHGHGDWASFEPQARKWLASARASAQGEKGNGNG